MTLAPVEAIRIESTTRGDALDLVRRLPELHTHLVQLGDSRWHVCVKPYGSAEDLIPSLLDRAGLWASERSLDSVLRIGDRAYDLHA